MVEESIQHIKSFNSYCNDFKSKYVISTSKRWINFTALYSSIINYMLSVQNCNPETKLFHINTSELRHGSIPGQYHVSWPCAISVGSHDGCCSAAMELRLLIGFGVEHCLHLAFKNKKLRLTKHLFIYIRCFLQKKNNNSDFLNQCECKNISIAV